MCWNPPLKLLSVDTKGIHGNYFFCISRCHMCTICKRNLTRKIEISFTDFWLFWSLKAKWAVTLGKGHVYQIVTGSKFMMKQCWRSIRILVLSSRVYNTTCLRLLYFSLNWQKELVYIRAARQIRRRRDMHTITQWPTDRNSLVSSGIRRLLCSVYVEAKQARHCLTFSSYLLFFCGDCGQLGPALPHSNGHLSYLHFYESLLPLSREYVECTFSGSRNHLLSDLSPSRRQNLHNPFGIFL